MPLNVVESIAANFIYVDIQYTDGKIHEKYETTLYYFHAVRYFFVKVTGVFFLFGLVFVLI